MALKKFIIRTLIFLLVAFPLISFESLYAYYTNSYEDTVNGNEVYLSLHKSKAKKKVKTLIIGDSVAKQMYDSETYNGDVYSLACNQAISLAGQYILLKQFIDNNTADLPDNIILIITPGSFTNNLDQVFSYHYFLKPFYKKEFANMLTDTCKTQINKIPLYYLSQMPFIVNTNWSPAYVPKEDASYHFISPISSNYLFKIKALCLARHLSFKMYCPPIKISKKQSNLNYFKNITEIKKTGLLNEFITYLKNIVYLPDSLYQDHIHFKKQYIPKDYFHLVAKSS